MQRLLRELTGNVTRAGLAGITLGQLFRSLEEDQRNRQTRGSAWDQFYEEACWKYISTESSLPEPRFHLFRRTSDTPSLRMVTGKGSKIRGRVNDARVALEGADAITFSKVQDDKELIEIVASQMMRDELLLMGKTLAVTNHRAYSVLEAIARLQYRGVFNQKGVKPSTVDELSFLKPKDLSYCLKMLVKIGIIKSETVIIQVKANPIVGKWLVHCRYYTEGRNRIMKSDYHPIGTRILPVEAIRAYVATILKERGPLSPKQCLQDVNKKFQVNFSNRRKALFIQEMLKGDPPLIVEDRGTGNFRLFDSNVQEYSYRSDSLRYDRPFFHQFFDVVEGRGSQGVAFVELANHFRTIDLHRLAKDLRERGSVANLIQLAPSSGHKEYRYFLFTDKKFLIYRYIVDQLNTTKIQTPEVVASPRTNRVSFDSRADRKQAVTEKGHIPLDHLLVALRDRKTGGAGSKADRKIVRMLCDTLVNEGKIGKTLSLRTQRRIYFDSAKHKEKDVLDRIRLSEESISGNSVSSTPKLPFKKQVKDSFPDYMNNVIQRVCHLHAFIMIDYLKSQGNRSNIINVMKMIHKQWVGVSVEYEELFEAIRSTEPNYNLVLVEDLPDHLKTIILMRNLYTSRLAKTMHYLVQYGVCVRFNKEMPHLYRMKEVASRSIFTDAISLAEVVRPFNLTTKNDIYRFWIEVNRERRLIRGTSTAVKGLSKQHRFVHLPLRGRAFKYQSYALSPDQKELLRSYYIERQNSDRTRQVQHPWNPSSLTHCIDEAFLTQCHLCPIATIQFFRWQVRADNIRTNSLFLGRLQTIIEAVKDIKQRRPKLFRSTSQNAKSSGAKPEDHKTKEDGHNQANTSDSEAMDVITLEDLEETQRLIRNGTEPDVTFEIDEETPNGIYARPRWRTATKGDHRSKIRAIANIIYRLNATLANGQFVNRHVDRHALYQKIAKEQKATTDISQFMKTIRWISVSSDSFPHIRLKQLWSAYADIQAKESNLSVQAISDPHVLGTYVPLTRSTYRKVVLGRQEEQKLDTLSERTEIDRVFIDHLIAFHLPSAPYLPQAMRKYLTNYSLEEINTAWEHLQSSYLQVRGDRPSGALGVLRRNIMDSNRRKVIHRHAYFAQEASNLEKVIYESGSTSVITEHHLVLPHDVYSILTLLMEGKLVVQFHASDPDIPFSWDVRAPFRMVGNVRIRHVPYAFGLSYLYNTQSTPKDNFTFAILPEEWKKSDQDSMLDRFPLDGSRYQPDTTTAVQKRHKKAIESLLQRILESGKRGVPMSIASEAVPSMKKTELRDILESNEQIVCVLGEEEEVFIHESSLPFWTVPMTDAPDHVVVEIVDSTVPSKKRKVEATDEMEIQDNLKRPNAPHTEEPPAKRRRVDLSAPVVSVESPPNPKDDIISSIVRVLDSRIAREPSDDLRVLYPWIDMNGQFQQGVYTYLRNWLLDVIREHPGITHDKLVAALPFRKTIVTYLIQSVIRDGLATKADVVLPPPPSLFIDASKSRHTAVYHYHKFASGNTE